MTAATGDEFSLALYNDIHAENTAGAWTEAVDWLLGANSRGPGGTCGTACSAITRFNVKAIAGVGDYTTACTSAGASCDAAFAVFMTDFPRITALGLPGIWPQGNHDTADYTPTFGSTLQSSTFSVPVTGGTVKLGFVGVGVADDMTSGASRTYVDGVIAADITANPTRQWMVFRHVMTFASQLNSPPYWQVGIFCNDATTCAGNVAPNDGVTFRDNFLVQEPHIWWAFGGHSGWTTNIQTTANDGHVINTTGNKGASGGSAGYITMMKFKPASHTIDVQVWLTYGSPAIGYPYTDVFTWAWTPQLVAAAQSTLGGKLSVSGGVVVK